MEGRWRKGVPIFDAGRLDGELWQAIKLCLNLKRGRWVSTLKGARYRGRNVLEAIYPKLAYSLLTIQQGILI